MNMKNMLTLIVLLSSWLTVYSQESYTETELKQKCDSIVEEANTLYRYETAAWNFTDMFLPKPELMETIQGILTYQQGDTIKCLVIDNQSQCTYEVSFLNETTPCSEVTTHRGHFCIMAFCICHLPLLAWRLPFFEMKLTLLA